ncbi:hypothetical protein NS228_13760 [Methylobacterium indicum]|uniref:hypothetical protein n=1 Tax=Methylobacterium indicum TaxID=1775910 RepID=UPI0007344180|nr:hypothetical protein [Methylobacterium indicum]KTS37980.1 hypothetical protein NS229_05075 [Methylobacterium indicum]KTS39844.1 hypothetical protein NS228_13760 [Methylobacterium indicum]KTS54618.1 hypothetical protein NS230_01005 [Methylobacterium indicum]
MSARSLILATLALLALAGPVAAADLDDDPPPRFEGRGEWRPTPPPPPEPPRFESRGEWRPAPPPPPRFAQGPGPCRVFVKRRIDPDGDEVVRRVRVCDEGPGYREGGYRDGPRWGGPPPWHRHRHWDDEPGPGRW